MILIYEGLPRSGKTYRAVDYIYNNFLNDKSSNFSKHRQLYTNIGGFNHDFVNNILIKRPVILNDNAFVKQSFKFVWNDFYSVLQECFDMFEHEKSDDEIVSFLKSHNYHLVLLILDEAYVQFNKRSNPVLVWFLAYHAHLGFDIIFITQSVSLLHSDYRQFTEFYYQAQPISKGLRSGVFRYHHKDASGNKFDSDKIKSNKDIFKLYKSGDIHKPKKIIYKFIFLGLIIFSILIFIFYFLFSRMSSDSVSDDNISSDNIEVTSPDALVSADSSKTIILKLRCDTDSCWSINPKFKKSEISVKYLFYLVDNYDIILKYQEVSNNIYTMISTDNKHYKKLSLASFTDFIFEVPKDLKFSYFSDFFIPLVPDKKKNLLKNSLFSSSSPSSSSFGKPN